MQIKTPCTLSHESWDGTEYATIVDADGRLICSEPVDFCAYPEGAFIETIHETHSTPPRAA